MPLVHVPSMISSLQKISGAVVPGQNGPIRPTSRFPVKPLWLPTEGTTEFGPSSRPDDGQDPLDGVLASSISDEDLGQAILKSSTVPSPWGSSEEDGTDALAWYVSFHRDPHNWGIYLPVSGLLRFAKHMAPNGPGESGWQGVLDLALRGLLAHERVHYAVDFGAGQIELLFNAPCYIPARTALSNGRYVPDEERLANGASLRSIRWKPRSLSVPGSFEAAVQFTLTQPPGYCDGITCIEAHLFLDFANGFMGRVASQLPTTVNPPAARPIDYTKFLPLGPLVDHRGRASRMASVDGTQCPVYLIQDDSILGLPVGSIANIDHVPSVAHSPKFERQLRKLGMQREWDDVKVVLADPSIPLPKGKLRFEQCGLAKGPGAIGWSVRVGEGNTNIRAHIQQHKRTAEWIATEIGNADKLKHH
jgi:hypothetical protein